MRKNLFQILNNELTDEMQVFHQHMRIRELFSDTKIKFNDEFLTIEEYIDKFEFMNWKYRKQCINLSDFGLCYEIPGIGDWDCIESLDELLLYLEFVINILILVENKRIKGVKKIISTIYESVNVFLDSKNYKIIEIDDKKIIIKKSEIISRIAEKNVDIAPYILEYGSISLKGNIAKKKELILHITHKYEGVEQKLRSNSYTNLVQNIGTLVNNLNIRHNNIAGKNANNIVKKLNNEELESWYDKTYDTLLLALMASTYIDIKNDIENFNISLKSK